MDNNSKAKKIIEDNLYMTISVSTTKGDPWIANLFFACDVQYNFFWYSNPKSLHSQYLQNNPQAAIAIFNSTAIGDDVDAVYIKASITEVTDTQELLHGLKTYANKMLKTGFSNTTAQVTKFINSYKDFQGDSRVRLYKATPIMVWKLAPSETFNDKYVDSRIEVKLNE